MARPFDFGPREKTTARLRQRGLCAHCGDSLGSVWEEAHHVVPNQSGQAGAPAHQWLKSADNCVILCDGCHERVHEDGKYQKGAVAPPDYYRHSHGGDIAGHRRWAETLERQSRSIWR